MTVEQIEKELFKDAEVKKQIELLKKNNAPEQYEKQIKHIYDVIKSFQIIKG